MAMFNSSKESKQEIEKISNAATNIGKGATFSGNIDTFGNVRIDGKLVGDIKSQSKVATGEASVVEGSLVAKNAEIEGEVFGKIEVSELLVLKSTAKIQGDILTNKLIVEAGAIFNGSCQMGDVEKKSSANLDPKKVLNTKEPEKTKPVMSGFKV